eukprot:364868-Chlamydomonas_euryale.AAC.12
MRVASRRMLGPYGGRTLTWHADLAHADLAHANLACRPGMRLAFANPQNPPAAPRWPPCGASFPQATTPACSCCCRASTTLCARCRASMGGTTSRLRSTPTPSAGWSTPSPLR